MKKYNIKNNSDKFSEEEIAKQKNFDQFLTNYKSQASAMSAGKITLGILATGMLVTVLLLNIKKNAADENNKLSVTEKKNMFVDPPLKGIDIPYDTFSVDPTKGAELHYKTGSVLKVPANAFLDKNNNPVKNKVTLRYREFHDVGDIFISGIPMTYDSAGTRYHFESAGMMELLAYDGDEPLNVNPEAQVNVELASNQPGDYFNVYYLDTAKRNWDFVERDTAGISPNIISKMDSLLNVNSPDKIANKINADLKDIDNQLAENKKNDPLEPKKMDKDRYQVKIDVKEEEFPEITAYKDVLFEISPTEKDFKPEYSKKVWENVAIARGSEKQNYLITFTKGQERHSFKCMPVLADKDYNAASGLFDKLHAKYLSFIADRKKKRSDKQKELEYLHAQQKNKYKSLNDSTSNSLMSWSAVSEKEMFIKRVFEVSKFGMWNCDCPSALPKGMLVNAKFVDSTGKILKFDHAYLVQKGKNALFTYYSSAFNVFQYNPTKQNMVWAVAPGNKFAWFPVERFSKLKTVNDTTVFEMKVANKHFANSQEVKTFMNI